MLRQLLKLVLSVAVSAATVLSPIANVHAEDVEEARGPASVRAALQPVPEFTEVQEKEIRNSVFNTAVLNSKLVRTHRDFDRYALNGLSESDKKIFADRMAKIPDGHIPTLKNENGELVVRFASGDQQVKLRLTWPDVRKTIYYINGIKFVYNPEKPLAPQLDFIVQKLMARKLVSAWDLLESSAAADDIGDALLNPLDKVTNHVSPSSAATAVKAGTTAVTAAEAAAAAEKPKRLIGRLAAKLPKSVLTSVGSIVLYMYIAPKFGEAGGNGVFDVARSSYCTVLDKMNGVGLMYMCSTWRLEQIDRLKKTNPNGNLTKEAAVLARFEFDDATVVCPDNEDGKPRVLSGKIRAIGFDANNKKSFSGVWYNARFVWTPTGTAQSLIVVPSEMDASQPITDPAQVHRILMSLNFDKDGYLTGTNVPNEKWVGESSGLLVNTTKTLSVDKIMTPDEAATYEKSKDVLFTSLTTAKQCIVQKAQKAVSENQSPVKAPAAGTAPAAATQSVAPVPVVQ